MFKEQDIFIRHPDLYIEEEEKEEEQDRLTDYELEFFCFCLDIYEQIDNSKKED